MKIPEGMKVTEGGKYVVQADADCGGFLIMTPEGDIRWAHDKRTAERYVREMENGLASGCEMRVATIEWRGVTG